MKVVLLGLNGSWSHTNLALRCLREPLEREGFETVLLEYTVKDRSAHVLQALYEEQADVYGFSCYIWNLPQMLSLAQSLHQLLPACRIVLGGPEVSHDTQRFDDFRWIDCIICGEGEESWPALCRAIRDSSSYERIIQGGKPRVMEDEGILYRNGETCGGILYYESSRGCPYSCGYCLSSATTGVRFKSVEQTLTDLEAFEALQVECRIIKLVDRTFNANVERANRIWEALLSPKFTKQYHFEVCASLLNEESFRILEQFPKGKVQLEFGLQSTNPETLKAVSRHIEPQKVIKAVGRIKKMGNIHVHLDLIAGLPYEDYRSFGRSFNDSYGCCDLLQLGFLKLLHGTKLRAQAEEYGYVALPDPPYTVLQSKWLSYPEMMRLHHIAEALERFEESGRFQRSLKLVMQQVESPFAFWEGLCEFLAQKDPRPLQKLSQPDVYRYFLEYAGQGLSEEQLAQLKTCLAEEFSQHEHKHPPYFLR